jgi:hypothetical protein
VRITITGGTGSLAQYVQDALAGEHELVLFDRVRPDQNRFRYELKGRQAFISTEKAKKALSWKPEHSWTQYLKVGATR